MSQANESNDRSIDRQLRVFERRLTRLEATQLTGKEVNLSFDRVYDEIDVLEEQMNDRFDRLEDRFDRLESEMNAKFSELNNKFDIVMRHITGQGN
ncbi:MAG: hypothetical protein KME17_22965 [Cyanosarcina radialis HA8281-LM2]|jgi:ubiquinone biosynthesis protein UbiJ|nr:hypothetical protein [Cyanosarcina radialis HA8281-LM2]